MDPGIEEVHHRLIIVDLLEATRNKAGGHRNKDGGHKITRPTQTTLTIPTIIQKPTRVSIMIKC